MFELNTDPMAPAQEKRAWPSDTCMLQSSHKAVSFQHCKKPPLLLPICKPHLCTNRKRPRLIAGSLTVLV